jgi:dTDP-4-dehydrorhamnose reductase
MPGDILLTGGTGRLGSALRELVPLAPAPNRQELDITDLQSIHNAFAKYQPRAVIHAAAYTNVAAAETEKDLCWMVNVEGTRNLVTVALAHGVQVIYISTDYVFWGDKGGYKEEDPVGPVRNYYALSKLVAEEIVRILPKHLIIRTSFRASPFPYPVAYTDLYTSQDYLEVIAPEIALAINHYEQLPSTLHIATERKSTYALAVRTKPDVQAQTKVNSGVALPEDISLDSTLWNQLKTRWGR